MLNFCYYSRIMTEHIKRRQTRREIVLQFSADMRQAIYLSRT